MVYWVLVFEFFTFEVSHFSQLGEGVDDDGADNTQQNHDNDGEEEVIEDGTVEEVTGFLAVVRVEEKISDSASAPDTEVDEGDETLEEIVAEVEPVVFKEDVVLPQFGEISHTAEPEDQNEDE